MFDCVALLPLDALVIHSNVVPVIVNFGRNKHAAGTRFEHLGMTLQTVTNEQKVLEAGDSKSPKGVDASLQLHRVVQCDQVF